ncbi:MAG: hypothetical protein E7410_06130, partial [Ruminococcaceae bacterium]|nr:hypothetical protein [Oscillospiraceae bacterium]
MAFDARDFQNARRAEYNKGKGTKKLVWVLLAIIVAFIAVALMSIVINYIEIKEIGAQYVSSFFTNIKVRIIAQMVSFLIVFIVFTINNFVLRRILIKENADLWYISKIVPMVLLTFVISLVASSFISDNVYSRFLSFANATSFNRVDPVFFQDIGYYIFIRPFMESLIDSIKVILIIQTVYTALIYLFLNMRNGIENFGDVLKNKRIVTHNIVNVLLVFISIAMSFKYNAEEILYGNFGELSGAGYT